MLIYDYYSLLLYNYKMDADEPELAWIPLSQHTMCDLDLWPPESNQVMSSGEYSTCIFESW